MDIEGRVDKMQDAISNMDKRMSYNIRLFGSIMYETETKKKNEFKEFNLMKRECMNDRLTKANLKFKKMGLPMEKKLDMKTKDDKLLIEQLKKNLQGIEN